MANDITNILDVTGPEEELKRFRDTVESREKDSKMVKIVKTFVFNFNSTIPMPDVLEGTTSPCPDNNVSEIKKQLEYKRMYGAGNWYDWRCKYWGTKWGAYDADEPEVIDKGVRYRFDTAWAPPGAWLRTTAKLFPKLHFTDSWIDEGGGAGVLNIWHEDGEWIYSSDALSDHDWKIQFDNAYKDEYGFITEGDYKEVINSYVDLETPNYSDLNPFLLDRLKDDDLPLFVKFEWYNTEQAFLNRLGKAGG